MIGSMYVQSAFYSCITSGSLRCLNPDFSSPCSDAMEDRLRPSLSVALFQPEASPTIFCLLIHCQGPSQLKRCWISRSPNLQQVW